MPRGLQSPGDGLAGTLVPFDAAYRTGAGPIWGRRCKTYTSAALDQFSTNVELRLVGYDVLRANDKPAEADKALEEIRDLAEATPWRYQDAASKVILGRAFLRAGADARQVLEQYYDVAKKASPEAPESYYATGELALLKQDYALAATAFTDAAKRSPDDPDIYLGLAQAYESDEDAAAAALNKALEINPRHIESLLFEVDNLIDREAYTDANKVLDKVLDINPKYPQAWAYRAVIAHLSGDHKLEAAARRAALDSWSTNPEVDFLIGQKLSRNYRFVEGSAYQNKALAFMPGYGPAQVQLCQDLLRLGNEEEGWQLANVAFKDDPYNVLAYNLVTLHDTLAKYQTITDDHFIIRM